MKKQGFTLIEILVVIAIIASIISIAIPNYLEARQRAQDARTKSDMAQLTSALRLYYSDYQGYPAGDAGMIAGCGVTHANRCPCLPPGGGDIAFAAGGATGCDIVYMKQFPSYLGSQTGIMYYQALSGDDFCLGATINNKSDPDVAASQTRCSIACGGNASYATKYWVCAD